MSDESALDHPAVKEFLFMVRRLMLSFCAYVKKYYEEKK